MGIQLPAHLQVLLAGVALVSVGMSSITSYTSTTVTSFIHWGSILQTMTAARPRCSVLQAGCSDQQLPSLILDITSGCLLQTGFMLAGDGVPKIWNMALSPNKAYAAVVQSAPADHQKLQVDV